MSDVTTLLQDNKSHGRFIGMKTRMYTECRSIAAKMVDEMLVKKCYT